MQALTGDIFEAATEAHVAYLAAQDRFQSADRALRGVGHALPHTDPRIVEWGAANAAEIQARRTYRDARDTVRSLHL